MRFVWKQTFFIGHSLYFIKKMKKWIKKGYGKIVNANCKDKVHWKGNSFLLQIACHFLCNWFNLSMNTVYRYTAYKYCVSNKEEKQTSNQKLLY